MATKRPDPSKESSERAAMSSALTKVTDIMAGAERIRSKASAYLPKYEDEGDKEYARRLKCAPWRPEFTDTVESLASRPFHREVSLVGDPHPQIKEFVEDVDGRGNNLTQFAKTAFVNGVAKGLHVIFVDFPPSDGTTKSRAQEREANLRPYWVHVHFEDVVALYTTWVGGVEVPTHFRYRRTVKRPDGFDEVVVETVRVYEPGTWEVYEKREDSEGKSEWVVPENGSGTLTRGSKKLVGIPMVLFFTGERDGVLETKPPLQDLAEMQLELYRALSRQDEILTFAGSPMLTASGLSAPADKKPIPVGPKTILYAPMSPSGASTLPKWEYISPNSGNISEIGKHVESIENAMRRLGKRPLSRKGVNHTAIGDASEATQAHSQVKSWALGLKDVLEQALKFTCEYLNLEPNVEVNVYVDFEAVAGDATSLSSLDAARDRGDLSQETYWDGLRRFEVLPPDFDQAQERKRLAVEKPPALPAPTPADPPRPPDPTADA